MNATPEDWMAEVLLCPGRIEEAARALRGAKITLEDRKQRLAENEARILLENGFTLKNKEGRDAEIFLATGELRNLVAFAERCVSEAQIRLAREENRFSALKAVLRYQAREEG